MRVSSAENQKRGAKNLFLISSKSSNSSDSNSVAVNEDFDRMESDRKLVSSIGALAGNEKGKGNLLD